MLPLILRTILYLLDEVVSRRWWLKERPKGYISGHSCFGDHRRVLGCFAIAAVRHTSMPLASRFLF